MKRGRKTKIPEKIEKGKKSAILWSNVPVLKYLLLRLIGASKQKVKQAFKTISSHSICLPIVQKCMLCMSLDCLFEKKKLLSVKQGFSEVSAFGRSAVNWKRINNWRALRASREKGRFFGKLKLIVMVKRSVAGNEIDANVLFQKISLLNTLKRSKNAPAVPSQLSFAATVMQNRRGDEGCVWRQSSLRRCWSRLAKYTKARKLIKRKLSLVNAAFQTFKDKTRKNVQLLLEEPIEYLAEEYEEVREVSIKSMQFRRKMTKHVMQIRQSRQAHLSVILESSHIFFQKIMQKLINRKKRESLSFIKEFSAGPVLREHLGTLKTIAQQLRAMQWEKDKILIENTCLTNKLRSGSQNEELIHR